MTEDLTPSPPGKVPPSDSESSRAEESPDFSALETPPTGHPQTIPNAPYDPEPQRERIRGRIAQILLGMLASVLLLTFISMWVGMKAEVLQTVLTTFLLPS